MSNCEWMNHWQVLLYQIEFSRSCPVNPFFANVSAKLSDNRSTPRIVDTPRDSHSLASVGSYHLISPTMASKEFTLSDVSEHATKNDLYMVVHDKVYDCGKFVDEHPYVNIYYSIVAHSWRVGLLCQTLSICYGRTHSENYLSLLTFTILICSCDI